MSTNIGESFAFLYEMLQNFRQGYGVLLRDHQSDRLINLGELLAQFQTNFSPYGTEKGTNVYAYTVICIRLKPGLDSCVTIHQGTYVSAVQRWLHSCCIHISVNVNVLAKGHSNCKAPRGSRINQLECRTCADWDLRGMCIGLFSTICN